MTPEQLKASILQRAMEGKLVPQDPNDEPASELLKIIKAEKKKLIKEGKIKRDKNESEIFKGDDGLHYEKFASGTIKEVEVPFEIPESWQWTRMRNITKIIGDGIHGTPKFSGTGNYYFINGSNLKNPNIVVDDRTKKIEYEEYVKNKRWLDSATLLLSINGTLGNIAFYKDEKIVLGKSAAYINYLIPELRNYNAVFLGSPLFEIYYEEKQTGTTIKNIPLSALRDCLIPLPPIDEQSRIVRRIKHLLDKLSTYSKSYNKLEKLNKKFPDKLKKSILQYAMQGKLVPQNPNDEPVEVLLEKMRTEKQHLFKEGKLKKKDLEESIIFKGDDNSYYEAKDKKVYIVDVPFDIPASWRWLRLGNVSDLYTGNSISKNIKESKFMNITDGYPYIATKDVISHSKIDYNNGVKIPYTEKKFRISTPNSILLCIEGGSAGRKMAINDRVICFGNKLCNLSLYGINHKWIFAYIQSPEFFSNFSSNMSGIIGGVGVSKLKEIFVPVASRDEINNIIQLTDLLFEKLSILD